MPARILIVDDHAIVRTTVGELLDYYSMQLCGEARDGKEAIDKVIELKPDIVLMDINMPVMNGTQAAYEIRQIAPATKIVFFTVHDGPEIMTRTRAFAHGFVSKWTAGTELIPTLNRVAKMHN